MSNKLSLYVKDGWVLMSNNGNQVYQDIMSNFVKDYGKELSFTSAEYNPDTGINIIDGIQQESTRNLECDAIFDDIIDIMAKQSRRGYIVPKDLDEVKQAQINELKASRDSAERTPVVTDKGTFDVDSVSLERINGAITVLKISGGTLEWTLADNTVVSVTADDLTNVIVALAQQSNSVHEKYRLLKAKVEACTTVDEVEAITWDTPVE